MVPIVELIDDLKRCQKGCSAGLIGINALAGFAYCVEELHITARKADGSLIEGSLDAGTSRSDYVNNQTYVGPYTRVTYNGERFRISRGVPQLAIREIYSIGGIELTFNFGYASQPGIVLDSIKDCIVWRSLTLEQNDNANGVDEQYNGITLRVCLNQDLVVERWSSNFGQFL